MPPSLAVSALLFPAETLVNRLIARDSHIAGNLFRFRGKRVEARTPHMGLNLLFEADGIRLRALDSEAPCEPADVIVRGTAPQLLRLLAGSERPLAEREIRVEGDAELLLDLQRALDEIDVRWEDYLGPVLGDILTEGLSSAVTDARDLARDAGGNIKRNLENFVQYEAGVMPTPDELGLFTARVDELRLRLDRLRARVEIISRNRGAPDVGALDAD